MLKRRLPLYAAAIAAIPLAALPGGNAILAVLGVGFLIFIHEWGHFYACRLTGTRTETFSIGFGPRLFGWEKDREGNRRFTTGARQLDPEDHAMDFRIAIIPLGGYVKMAGELPGEATTGAPDEFPQKSASARAFIISAGVIMNFITAVVFYSIAYGSGKPFEPPVVARIIPGSPAQEAGLRAGDRVFEIDGRNIQDRVDLLTESALMTRKRPVEIRYERDGREGDPITIQGRYNEAEGRMVAGIQVPGFTLAIGEGDTAFEVGPQETGTAAGVPFTGGSDAANTIKTLLLAGITNVNVAVGERTTTVALAPLKTDDTAEGDAKKKAEPLPAKVGIGAYRPATVSKAWGAAADVLKKGDVLVGVVTASGIQAILSPLDLTAIAATAGPVTAIQVKRAGEDAISLPAQLSDAASISAFFENVSLTFAPTSRRIYVIDNGRRHYEEGTVLYRLDGSPAQDAGLVNGSEIVQIGSRDVASMDEIISTLANVKADERVDVWVKTESDRRKLTITPRTLTPVGSMPEMLLTPMVEYHNTDGFFGAAAAGLGRTLREVKNVFRTIGALFEGRLSFQKNIAGPITLVTVSKASADQGPLRLLWFLAYISVMLAVMNILPIPVLDGGHLLFILIEKIKGSPLSDSMMIRFQQVGILMLLTLMFFAFKNDIMRLLK